MSNVVPTASYPAILGKTIVGLREEIGMDQQTLAKKVGISPSTWSKIERGVSALSIDQLALAAQALGMTPGHITTTADRTAEALASKGIKISPNRVSESIDNGLVLVGAAAIGLALAAILSRK